MALRVTRDFTEEPMEWSKTSAYPGHPAMQYEFDFFFYRAVKTKGRVVSPLKRIFLIRSDPMTFYFIIGIGVNLPIIIRIVWDPVSFSSVFTQPFPFSSVCSLFLL